MASNFPPDGWELDPGVWGTDFDQVTTPVLSGTYAVIAKSGGTSAAKLTSPWIPLEFGRAYAISATVRADRNNPGDTVSIQYRIYDSSKAFVLAIPMIPSGLVQAPNAWEKYKRYIVTTAGQFWLRFQFSGTPAAFNYYIDSVGCIEAPFSFHAYRATSNQSVPTGVWTKIEFNTEEAYSVGPSGAGTLNHDIGGNYDSAAGYDFTAPVAGFYVFNVAVLLDVTADTTIFLGQFYKNGGIFKRVLGQNNGAGGFVAGGNSGPVWLDVGDTIDFRVWHNHPVNWDVLLGPRFTYFSGFHLRG